jgi:hypothetical protein
MIWLVFGIIFFILGAAQGGVIFLVGGPIMIAIGIGHMMVKHSGDRLRQQQEAEIRARQLRILRGEYGPPAPPN